MVAPQTTVWTVDLFIGESNINYGGDQGSRGGTTGLNAIRRFEWMSFINDGFMVRTVIESPDLMLDKVFNKEYFLDARQLDKPTFMRFRIGWSEGDKTPWRTAVLTDIYVQGGGARSGSFEFIAVDPITFYINQGTSSGRVYNGRLGTIESNGKKVPGVIEQVLDTYVPKETSRIGPEKRPDLIGRSLKFKIDKKVSTTEDPPFRYHMMRQDPKTFIMSLLDWSSPFTKHKLDWIVNMGEDEDENGQTTLSINIEENFAPWLNARPFKEEGKQIFLRYGGSSQQELSDIINWEFIANPFISTLNTRLVTSGISAISGQYFDIDTADHDPTRTDFKSGKGSVFVDDKNTTLKSNPQFEIDRGFRKPTIINSPGTKAGLGTTYIHSVPEFSAGELGRNYGLYIDGRARQIYLNMANLVSRLRVTSRGIRDLFDPRELGTSFITLQFLKASIDFNDRNSDTPFNGNWLLYGWHHTLLASTGNWTTDVYMSRLDFDARSVPGSSFAQKDITALAEQFRRTGTITAGGTAITAGGTAIA